MRWRAWYIVQLLRKLANLFIGSMAEAKWVSGGDEQFERGRGCGVQER